MDDVNKQGELWGQDHRDLNERSRAYFKKFAKEIPPEVNQHLDRGKLRLTDYSIYSVKQVISKTVKIFETQDVRESSLRNYSAAKLQKNQVLLVWGITVLAGVSTDLTSDKVKAIDWKSISQFPALVNGEFSLKANKVTIVSENMPMRRFATDNDNSVPLGFWPLDNPRLVKDDELIEFVIELGSLDGLAANTHFFVALNGTATTP